MVGKLDGMVTAAVVIDSTFKTYSSSAQSVNSTEQIKPVDSKQQPSASMLKTQAPPPKAQDPLKPQEPKTLAQKAEEDKKEQESRLQPGTMPEESVKEVVDAVNKLMKENRVNLKFAYDKEVEILNVKVIDPETKKVLREFPPEEMIENMKKAREWLGALIDKAI